MSTGSGCQATERHLLNIFMMINKLTNLLLFLFTLQSGKTTIILLYNPHIGAMVIVQLLIHSKHWRMRKGYNSCFMCLCVCQ